MRETKAEMLIRKNAEIRTLQARLRGISRRLEPLARMSNCTIAIGEILLLLDFTNDQAGSFAMEAPYQKLKNFDNKVVDAYCTLHFETSFEEKLEDVKRGWLDKLEEQMLEEQNASMEDSQ